MGRKDDFKNVMEYLPIVISIVSLLFALYSWSIKNNKDNNTELTTVIVKLENIGAGISDIKTEIANMKNDQKEDHDRLIKLESSVSTMWKRMDEVRGVNYETGK